MEDLLQKAAELQVAVRRLHNVRKAEELDRQFQAQHAVDPLCMAKQSKTLPMAHIQRREGNNGEEWKPAAKRICRRIRLSPEVPLQNCFSTLQSEEEISVTSGEMLALGKAP